MNAKKLILYVMLVASLLAACEFPLRATPSPTIVPSATPPPTNTKTATPLPPTSTQTTTPIPPTATATLTPIPTDTATATPQPRLAPAVFGPDIEDFPPGYSTLSGIPLPDPSVIDLPAVLVSISNFPPSARPQAGLSFAPYIFEIYISEGMTRFLTVFYGEYPQHETPVLGDCVIRRDPIERTNLLVGNFVWFDANANGIQDPGERGIPGVCVNLYDAATGSLLKGTSTDTNGYYGFDVTPDQRKYGIEIIRPPYLTFTQPDVGDDDRDSDIDPQTGKTIAFEITANDFSWDAGLTGKAEEIPSPTPATGTPETTSFTLPPLDVPPKVGPIRSGRLPYAYLRDMFQWGCLVHASASQEILALMRGCANVFGTDEDINAAMMNVTMMKKIAEANAVPGQQVNYSGNLFSEQPPEGGQDAQQLTVFYSFLNQTQWRYDPLSGAYMRYDDRAEGSGNFYPSTDRLTGRQLLFQNVIIIYAKHHALQPTIIDIALQQGLQERAVLFRDGKAYKIYWNTYAQQWELDTKMRRPMMFAYSGWSQGIPPEPFPLKPGHTWVHVFSDTSAVWEEAPGEWMARFYPPEGTE